MRLTFKDKRFGREYLIERDVDIMLNISTLIDLSKDLDIEFWQIGDMLKKDSFDMISGLLYHGYITACKEKYQRPVYTKSHAELWHEKMSQTAIKEFKELMENLFGQIQKMSGPKKKVNQNPHGRK